MSPTEPPVLMPWAKEVDLVDTLEPFAARSPNLFAADSAGLVRRAVTLDQNSQDLGASLRIFLGSDGQEAGYELDVHGHAYQKPPSCRMIWTYRS